MRRPLPPRWSKAATRRRPGSKGVEATVSEHKPALSAEALRLGGDHASMARMCPAPGPDHATRSGVGLVPQVKVNCTLESLEMYCAEKGPNTRPKVVPPDRPT